MKIRALLVALGLMVGVVGLDQAKAEAYPWDPHVLVVGSVGTCGPNKYNGWGWIDASNGERGWVTWSSNGSSTFTFQLNRVPTSGVNITIKWGVASCSAVATGT